MPRVREDQRQVRSLFPRPIKLTRPVGFTPFQGQIKAAHDATSIVCFSFPSNYEGKLCLSFPPRKVACCSNSHRGPLCQKRTEEKIVTVNSSSCVREKKRILSMRKKGSSSSLSRSLLMVLLRTNRNSLQVRLITRLL